MLKYGENHCEAACCLGLEQRRMAGRSANQQGRFVALDIKPHPSSQRN